MTIAELKEILNLLQGFVIPLLIYCMYLLSDIRDHLAQLNGRVGTCEQLHRAHEESDKDKHESCEKRIETIERSFIEKKA